MQLEVADFETSGTTTGRASSTWAERWGYGLQESKAGRSSVLSGSTVAYHWLRLVVSCAHHLLMLAKFETAKHEGHEHVGLQCNSIQYKQAANTPGTSPSKVIVQASCSVSLWAPSRSRLSTGPSTVEPRLLLAWTFLPRTRCFGTMSRT